MPNEDLIADLLTAARDRRAHLTIHGDYTPNASRAPDPDWLVQIVWTSSDDDAADGPRSAFGTGPGLVDAATDMLGKLA